MMSKKLLGLPLPVWLGVAAAGLLLGIYLRRRSSTSTATGSSTSFPTSDPNAGTSAASGDIGSALAGGGVAPTGSGYDPTTQNNLLAGIGTSIDAETQAISGLADALGVFAYNIPSSAGGGSSVIGQDSSHPLITSTYPAPKPKAQPAAKAKAPAAAPAKVTYFTLKKNVKLKQGQTIHYTPKKGYYAA